ncbi:hypothetical protein PEC301653_05680 [Pectobacterium carotovorum subsp. carotovorum]|nr:hypothetical protein PEC301653_05680 [Pectobacterium carotovorum subsp. carotovorum]
MTQKECFLAENDGDMRATDISSPTPLDRSRESRALLPQLRLSDGFTERIDGNNRVGDVFGR